MIETTHPRLTLISHYIVKITVRKKCFMPLSCWGKCLTLWELPCAHNIEDNKEKKTIRHGSSIERYNLFEEWCTTAGLNSLAVRIHFEAVERKNFSDEASCKLLWQPVAAFSIHFVLYWISFLSLLLLYLVLMISNEEGKNGPSDSLNSPPALCPCHLIDRCTLSPFSAVSCFQQSYPFIATFITWSRAVSFGAQCRVSGAWWIGWTSEIAEASPVAIWGHLVTCSVITERWATKSDCCLTYYKGHTGIFLLTLLHLSPIYALISNQMYHIAADGASMPASGYGNSRHTGFICLFTPLIKVAP